MLYVTKFESNVLFKLENLTSLVCVLNNSITVLNIFCLVNA